MSLPDLTNKNQHVYVTIHPDGTHSKMWIHEDADIQEHLDRHGMNDYVHAGSIPCVNPEKPWPKECPVVEEDIECHRMLKDKTGKCQFQFCPINSKKFHVNRLRADREVAFKDLDVQSMKNIESGRDNSEVIRKKNILRDMPTHSVWDKCSTLADFKNVSISKLLAKSNP